MATKSKSSTKAQANSDKAKKNPMSDTTLDLTTVQFVEELQKDVKAAWNGPKTPFTVYFDNKPWNPQTDLSLFKEYVQMLAGFSAVNKFATGMATGSPKLVVTAPEDKAGYERGTGLYGYVHSSFVPGVDDIVVDVNGAPTQLTVNPADIPPEGWRELLLAPKFGLYAPDNATYYTPRGEMYPDGNIKKVPWNVTNDAGEEVTIMRASSWRYWYCETLSTLLGRHNVSISVFSADAIVEAENCLAVIQAPNRLEANDERRANNRQDGKDVVEAKENAQTIRKENPDFKAPKGALVLELENGGPFDLAKVRIGEPIVPVSPVTGRPAKVRRLRVGDDAERIEMAQLFVSKGWKVRL